MKSARYWIAVVEIALAVAPPLASADVHPVVRRAILFRLAQLIGDCDEAQFKTAGELPPDRGFAVGQYPALVDFWLQTPDGFVKIIDDGVDASGSTFMGLWFLAQAHRILGDIPEVETGALRDAIEVQVERSAGLPAFFQGATPDVRSCPPETMGWYPLVEGRRLPAIVPDSLEAALPAETLNSLANLSDGDIWAWCMAIDDTMPGRLQYRRPITASTICEPLFSAGLNPKRIDPQARWLYWLVRGTLDPSGYPIGSFYGITEQSPQQFSTVVMANILSSLPLLEGASTRYAEAIENASRFVNRATTLALRGRVPWKVYAYDYYTIPGAAVAYVVRAHKRIIEIGDAGIPFLLEESTLDQIEWYVTLQALQALLNPDLHKPAGAEDYARLVYAFNTMMNVRFVDPTRFDPRLVDWVMLAALFPNRAAYDVAGTGPYQIVGPIWADMASIAFIAPPLVEAFALYLQSLCRSSG